MPRTIKGLELNMLEVDNSTRLWYPEFQTKRCNICETLEELATGTLQR
jgi:hypothetical protein